MKIVDKRRDIEIAKNKEDAIDFSVRHFLNLAKLSIEESGRFTVALSGGSTPKEIYKRLSLTKDEIDWSKVWLFWSDERGVPPTDQDSNYHMAMEAGLGLLPIPKNQIFRMEAERNIQEMADRYDSFIEKNLGPDLFDLIMLGMGEDGHTASLFPGTKALDVKNRAVVANYIKSKDSWRMTLTLDCINNSKNICFYVIGGAKKEMLKRILFPKSEADHLPAYHVGSEETKALWIVDVDAAPKLDLD